MHTNLCVLIEIAMEIEMIIFLLGLLVTALMEENYFSAKKVEDIKLILFSNLLLNVAKMEKSSYCPIKDYSNESNERNCSSCNYLHWTLDSSILQNFPHE